MRRVFAVIGFSFFFSTLFAIFLPIIATYIIIAAAVVLLTLYLVLLRGRYNSAVIAVITCIIIALSSFALKSNFEYPQIMQYDNSTAEITAVCTDYGVKASNSMKYNVYAKTVNGKNAGFMIKMYSREPIDVEAGDVIRFSAELSSKYCSPSFDYGQNTFLSCYINDSSTVSLCGEREASVSVMLTNIGQYFRQKMSEYMDEDVASFAKSFMFSDKSGLSFTDKSDFAKCGLSHTMAVSGLHMSIIIGSLYAFLMMLIKRKRAVNIICIIATFLLLFVVGFRYSALRAGLVLIFFFAGNLLSRKADYVNSLGELMTLFLLINPYTAIDCSFLLSYSATLGMVLIFKPLSEFLSAHLSFKYANIVIAFITPMLQSLCVNLVLLPLYALFFNSISIISPFANVVVLPLVSISLVFVAVFCLVSFIPFMASVVAWFCTVFIRLICCFVKLFASLPVTALPINPLILSLFAASALIFSAVAYWLIFSGANKKRTVITSVLLCVCLFFCGSITDMAANKDNVEIAVLDCGNGLCCAVYDHGNAMIIGLGNNADYSLGEYEQSHPITQCSAVILPELKNRYSQSAAYVLKYMKTDKIVAPINDDGIYSISAVSNAEMLDYSDSLIDFGKCKLNIKRQSKGIAMRLTYDNVSILLTDNKTDASLLPNEWKRTNILISTAGTPQNANEIGADASIVSTNKALTQSIGKTYSTKDNDVVSVVTNGREYYLK